MLGDHPFRLGPWHVDPVAFEARRGAETVRLEPKAVAVLVHLGEHAGRVVSRDALMGAVWPDVVVTEASLTRCVSRLRHALGDDARAPRLIETIPKAGYRLLVAPRPDPADATLPEAVGVETAEPSGSSVDSTEADRAAGRPTGTARRWGVAAVVALVVVVGAAVWASRPPPALQVTYRVDLAGEAQDVTVTVTGAEGGAVRHRPGAFPFAVTVAPGESAGPFRLRVEGRSTGADLRLSVVARRGGDEVARHETTGAVERGDARPFALYALLTLDD